MKMTILALWLSGESGPLIHTLGAKDQSKELAQEDKIITQFQSNSIYSENIYVKIRLQK